MLLLLALPDAPVRESDDMAAPPGVMDVGVSGALPRTDGWMEERRLRTHESNSPGIHTRPYFARTLREARDVAEDGAAASDARAARVAGAVGVVMSRLWRWLAALA